jgi:hypothetical protein
MRCQKFDQLKSEIRDPTSDISLGSLGSHQDISEVAQRVTLAEA